MELDKTLEKRKEYIEELVYGYLPKEEGYQKTIFDAMNYSMRAGGKRLRPMLILETYRIFGGKDEALVGPFMAAMEMIHTYSLVHDDLPAMDDDEYRRGRKTTHIVYGEAMGILAGDALLNYAFETAMKAFDVDGYTMHVAKALRVLAKKAGVFGMIGGQVVDVEATAQNETIGKEKLDFIYHLKTSALVEASMMIGAILADATDDQVAICEQIARKIGLAFQIQDDILDVTSTIEELGKPIHSDEKNNKVTYVTLFGLDEARAKVAEYTESGLVLLTNYTDTEDFLYKLLRNLVNRKN